MRTCAHAHNQALNFVESATLTRESLEEVMALFPRSAELVRQAAMKLAVSRMLVLLAGVARQMAAWQAPHEAELLATL